MTGTLPGALGVCGFLYLFFDDFLLTLCHIGSFSIWARPSAHFATYRASNFNFTPSQPIN